MTSNIAARAATSPELVKFRGLRQGSKLRLVMSDPSVIFSAQINKSFTSLDGVIQIEYDNETGDYTDIAEGMTIYIGTTAGAWDVGFCRVRKAATDAIIYIGAASLQFADNQYITVVDDYALWQRDTRQERNTVYMDYDIEFGDYRFGGCIPRVAPLASVIYFDAVTELAEFSPPDPTGSACYDGASIVSYLYDAPGAANTANMDTDHPVWDYDTAGEYKWSCSITDDYGRTLTTYRTLFVEPTETPFEFVDCSGSFSDGGWQFTVRCHDSVTVTPRALCVLYAEDWYDNTKGSIGKIAGYENIIATGWIDEESITIDSEAGSVEFVVKSAAQWFSKLRANPLELIDTTAAPSSWKQIQQMTVDKALAHLLMWTTTAPKVMDCYFTGDENRVKVFAEPSGTIFDQLTSISGRIFAAPLVNSYGQLYIEIDQQIIDASARAELPVVMNITASDREEKLDIERITSGKTSMLEFSAVLPYNGTNAYPVYSRAPGNTGIPHGDLSAFDDYVVESQAECNRIAGCLLASANNEFGEIEIAMPANNRLFDITPRMYATITISGSTNPRGVALTAARLIPRRVSYSYSAEDGGLETSVEFEVEAVGNDGVTYYPPPVVQTNPNYGDIGIGDFTGFPVGDLGDLFPDVYPSPPAGACSDLATNQFYGGWDKSEIRGDATDRISRCYYPCTLHGNAGYPSKVSGWTSYGDASTHWTLYAFKAGARVATANSSGEFDLASQLAVDGFEIELDSGLGTSVQYIPMEAIASGTVNANSVTGVLISGLSVGSYYAVQGSGGPCNIEPGWYMEPGTYWVQAYDATRRTGGIGYRAGKSPNIADLGDMGVFGEEVSTYHSRVYFKSAYSEIYVRVYDGDYYYGDNTGSVGYVVRNALVNGRRLVLSRALIQNVCGA